jgi:hypothetical protein
LPIGESQFRFAEVPEIVFVRGYADRELLGIFHIDTGNRWAPGDLDNDAGWQPRIDTNLEVVDGSLAGVSYDASTAVLRYDGGGSGNQTATVRLTAPGRSVSSARFRIRVLQPTVVWGVGAATRFPDIGLESSRVTWTDMQRSLRVDATDAAPNVLLVTGGRYESDFYIGRGKRNLYILGEPGARPTLVSGGLNLDDVEIGYLKNFELVDAVIDGSKFPTDRPVNVYRDAGLSARLDARAQWYRHARLRGRLRVRHRQGAEHADALDLEFPWRADGRARQPAPSVLHARAARRLSQHQQHPHRRFAQLQHHQVDEVLQRIRNSR